MKKIKRIFAVLLVFIIALSCTGCAELDEMRAAHATWVDDNRQTIQWNGSTYKRLPDNNLFAIWEYGYDFITLTMPDVPVLLSEQFGISLDCSVDKIFLENSWNDDGDPIYYCRDDRYDAVLKQMTGKIDLNAMVYSYWQRGEDGMGTFSLSAEQMKAVEAVLKTKPVSLGYNGYEEDYSVSLYRSSENYLFREEIGQISVLNGNYRLVVPGPEDFCYNIPRDQQDLFADIMKAYEENEVYYRY